MLVPYGVTYKYAVSVAVVFFGRRDMRGSLKWMGAFWLSVAGAPWLAEYVIKLQYSNDC